MNWSSAPPEVLFIGIEIVDGDIGRSENLSFCKVVPSGKVT